MNTRQNESFPRHRNIRLPEYDYSSPGAYFVTICTQNRKCFFGQIPALSGPNNRPFMVTTDAGMMIKDVWQNIPVNYPGFELDEFTVMPNHIHGIIIIPETNPSRTKELQGGRPQRVAPTELSLSDVIERFKSFTTKRYIDGVRQAGWQPFDGKLWQRGYYEKIIRVEIELNEIRQYIISNPLQWALDRENPDYR